MTWRGRSPAPSRSPSHPRPPYPAVHRQGARKGRYITRVFVSSSMGPGIELELPSLEEFQYHHAFLSIWGLVCLVVCCANMCVFFLSVLAAIDILNYSARESPWSLAETEMLSPPACPVRGTPEHVFVFDDQPALDTAEQMHVLWCQKHERRAKILWKTVSYCMPAFLLNAGFSTIAKFYMAPAAGWTGFVVSLLGMIVGLFWLVMPKTFDRSVDGQESNVTE